jgi:hypothetical protein
LAVTSQMSAALSHCWTFRFQAREENTRQNRWGMCVYTAYVYIWLWKL